MLNGILQCVYNEYLTFYGEKESIPRIIIERIINKLADKLKSVPYFTSDTAVDVDNVKRK